MLHTHRFVFPPQDGINPLGERMVGTCHCGETTEAAGYWDHPEFSLASRGVSAEAKKAADIDRFVSGIAFANYD